MAVTAVNDAVPVLDVADLKCQYGGVQAVAGASLSVKRGELVGLIGPNGAGKSTLVDCISGLNRDYSGTVNLLGEDVTRWPLHRRAKLGLGRSFQSARLFRRMSTLSNVIMGAPSGYGENPLLALFQRIWRPGDAAALKRAEELLANFGLSSISNSYGGELSGGQERLVELARVMMSAPKVLILDEPFSGVSPANRRRLADELVRLCKAENVAMLMVEHRLEWVREICDRVIVMANGVVIAQGDLETISRQDDVVAAYLGRPANADEPVEPA